MRLPKHGRGRFSPDPAPAEPPLPIQCRTCGAKNPDDSPYCSDGFHAKGPTYWPLDENDKPLPIQPDLIELKRQVSGLDWRAEVPDDLQSGVRMAFNEALAGGPNMNGDGGPGLTPNHARDCILATERITTLQAQRDEMEPLLSSIRTWVKGLPHDMESREQVLADLDAALAAIKSP